MYIVLVFYLFKNLFIVFIYLSKILLIKKFKYIQIKLK